MSIDSSRRTPICAAVLWFSVAILSSAAPSGAFVVNAYVSGNETLYLKWGDNHAGAPGGTVYWSFLPVGTPGSVFCGDACPGNSVDSINVEIAPGAGFAPMTLPMLEPQIVAAMAKWSARTGIRFVKLDNDTGVAINDPAAAPPVAGQVRIGAFAFGGNAGGAAVGYSPPPNGGTGAGDILFNALAYYQIAPGVDGDPYDQTFAPNDFEGLALHELGHAIGLEHPDYDGNCPVMCVDARCIGVIRRRMRGDDIDGAAFLYGTILMDGFE